ncbi:hypothetical protein N5J75_21625 [Pantoea brenneri]|uniref:hypothetical protein n=1 Tax=Pantoea brenneri TaxID=472694 RepID=UPI00244BF9F4|nr:hypothetical protein [Pantoea brenneri]MDH2125790.1 hypothetical protein [Pantoea brenneri]
MNVAHGLFSGWLRCEQNAAYDSKAKAFPECPTDYSECLVAILNADYGLIGFTGGNRFSCLSVAVTGWKADGALLHEWQAV